MGDRGTHGSYPSYWLFVDSEGEKSKFSVVTEQIQLTRRIYLGTHFFLAYGLAILNSSTDNILVKGHAPSPSLTDIYQSCFQGLAMTIK